MACTDHNWRSVKKLHFLACSSRFYDNIHHYLFGADAPALRMSKRLIIYYWKCKMADKPIEEYLTFDDVMLLPAFSKVLPKDVSIKTKFTRKLLLNSPLVSAPMDTVTSSNLAIALAQEGGIEIGRAHV